jgi:hypothetical protein
MRRLSPSIVLLAGLVAACADPEPFIDQGVTVTVDKTKPLSDAGSFPICYSARTSAAQVEQLAREHCGALGLQPIMTQASRWQCRATSPHQNTYRCVDPDLREADGSYINPLDTRAVAMWEKLNGKKAKVRTRSPGPEVVLPAQPAPADASTPPPPPPAPVPERVLTPADIAGKPAQPSQPVPIEPAPPPPPPLPNSSGFSLPQGSWGDHFQE